jgi:histidine triad (HIT) family protein
VVHSDETVLAFLDIRPLTTGHLLVIPRNPGDGFRLRAKWRRPPRAELDSVAERCAQAAPRGSAGSPAG